MVDYIGIERVQELVGAIGPARFMDGLAAEIEADYRRWSEFDKSARHACHSAVGVIELMPTIEPGMHPNAVGGDCPGKTELQVDILRRPDARDLKDPKDLFGGLGKFTPIQLRPRVQPASNAKVLA